MMFEHVRAMRWLVAPECTHPEECEQSHRIVKENGVTRRFHGQDVAVPIEGDALALFLTGLAQLMDEHGVVYVEAGEE